MSAEENQESDEELAPNIVNAESGAAVPNLLKIKSREKYEKTYNQFKLWCEQRNFPDYTDDVLLEFIGEQSKAPSTLWAIYFMLKASLIVNNNIDISKYPKLVAYLKQTPQGTPAPQRNDILSSEEIIKFLSEAPDEPYLFIKVCTILGIAGACSRHQLVNMTIDDIKDLGSAVIVKTPDTKTKIQKNVTVIDNKRVLDIYHKYASLRPANTDHRRFFLYYDKQKQKCSTQSVGVNTIGKVPSQIAKFLQMPNPDSYTGHCFRKSSPTILTGDWNSTVEAEGAVEDSETSATLPTEDQNVTTAVEGCIQDAEASAALPTGDQNLTAVAEGCVQNSDSSAKLPADGALNIKSEEDWNVKESNELILGDNESSDDDCLSFTPAPVDEAVSTSNYNLLSVKSRERYDKTYEEFLKWCKQKKVKDYTENVLFVYITERAKSCQSSTLSSIYFMLKSSLIVKDNIDIGKYSKLVAFVKQKTKGHRAKRSNTFTREEIHKFFSDAPDETYLMAKVCTIFGIAGGFRRDQLINLTIDDFQDLGSALIIKIPNTRTKNQESVIAVDNKSLLKIYRKYTSLRPPNTNHRRFFVYYDKRKQKCTSQVVGINTVGKVPSQIARFLRLPNPSLYTCQCFRRSSATLLSGAGIDISSAEPEDQIHYIQDNDSSNTAVSDAGMDSSQTNWTRDHNQDVEENEQKITNQIFASEYSITGMEQESEGELSSNQPPSDVVGATTTMNSLSLKSKEKYEKTYMEFVEWCQKRQTNKYTENVILTYITEKAKCSKSSTLFTTYSMLKLSLIVKNNIDIGKYTKILAFIKQTTSQSIKKTSNTFTREQILQFLFEAPNDTFLMKKVCTILGIAGGLRRDQLTQLTLDDIQDLGAALIIKLPDTRVRYQKNFPVIDDQRLLDIYHRYVSLRSPTTNHRRFFVFYDKHKQKCSTQVVGINTIGKIPNEIATFLGLPNPSSYTGHCFRRCSANILSGAGEYISTVEQVGNSNPTVVAEGYIQESDTFATLLSEAGVDISTITYEPNWKPRESYSSAALPSDAGDNNTTINSEASNLVEDIEKDMQRITDEILANEYSLTGAAQEPDDELICTTPPALDVVEAAGTSTLNTLPAKSKDKYEKTYNEFLSWCEQKKVKNYTENVLLVYITEKSKSCKSSTLWSLYSMIKATLIIKNNIDISKYTKLRAFLKRATIGYRAKRSSTFTRDEIHKFLSTAPDDIYLMTKVIAIFGIAGRYRCEQLKQLTIGDIKDLGSALIIKIPDTRSKSRKSNTVIDNKRLVHIFRKYASLRPPNTHHRRFFVFYDKQRLKCSTQVVGINTIGKIPNQIARFLRLPNPSSYTGHCFRRSSPALLYGAASDFEREGCSPESNLLVTTPSEARVDTSTNLNSISVAEDSNSSADATDARADSTSLNGEEDSELVEDCNQGSPVDVEVASTGLPIKSKERYEKTYKEFLNWCEQKNVTNYTENVLTAYITQKSKCCKSSTLWSIYSMIKASLIIKNNVDISKYSKLLAFLKRTTAGYRGEKSSTFTRDEIQKFLTHAPDDTYLMMKVCTILGIAGGYRREQLKDLSIDDIQDLGSALIIKIPDTRPKNRKSIIVIDNKRLLQIYRKYANLRPTNTKHRRFFVYYDKHKQKCTPQVVGINTIGKIPGQIAKFLKLPKPSSYTGHCFRRSSATLLLGAGADAGTYEQEENSNTPNQESDSFDYSPTDAVTEVASIKCEVDDPIQERVNAGPDIIDIKEEGDWRSSAVGEDYVHDSEVTRNPIHFTRNTTTRNIVTNETNDLETCRICLKSINLVMHTYFLLENEQSSSHSKIKTLLPEMDLNIPKKIFLCKVCHETLEKTYEFRMQCIRTENMIKKFMDSRSLINLDDFELKAVAFEFSDVINDVESENLPRPDNSSIPSSTQGSSNSEVMTKHNSLSLTIQEMEKVRDETLPSTSNLPHIDQHRNAFSKTLHEDILQNTSKQKSKSLNIVRSDGDVLQDPLALFTATSDTIFNKQRERNEIFHKSNTTIDPLLVNETTSNIRPDNNEPRPSNSSSTSANRDEFLEIAYCYEAESKRKPPRKVIETPIKDKTHENITIVNHEVARSSDNFILPQNDSLFQQGFPSIRLGLTCFRCNTQVTNEYVRIMEMVYCKNCARLDPYNSPNMLMGSQKFAQPHGFSGSSFMLPNNPMIPQTQNNYILIGDPESAQMQSTKRPYSTLVNVDEDVNRPKLPRLRQKPTTPMNMTVAEEGVNRPRLPRLRQKPEYLRNTK